MRASWPRVRSQAEWARGGMVSGGIRDWGFARAKEAWILDGKRRASRFFESPIANPASRPESRLHRSGEPIAGAAHGLHHAVELVWFQRLAQAADVDVHRALLHVHAAAPHVVQQLRAGVDAFGV